MAENWKDTLTDKLCDAFLKLETRQEVYDFLEDVATIGEIKALSQRLEVARLLSRAKTYLSTAKASKTRDGKGRGHERKSGPASCGALADYCLRRRSRPGYCLLRSRDQILP